MTNDIQKLTTTTETTSWIPSREYAGLIVQKAQAKRLLFGVAAAVEHAVGQGEGTVVRVRIFPKRTAQGPISEGASLTATVSSPTYADLTIQKFGDADELTGESIYQTKGPLVAKLLEAMAGGLARKKDEKVYDVLKAATPGASKTLGVAGTLTDLGNKILDCLAEGQAGDDVTYDTLLLGPDQINALRQIKNVDLQVGASVKLNENGEVVGFAGMKVINLMSIANRNATTAAMVQAILIDSSRAFGEAHGKPATFEERRVPLTDKYEEVVWDWYTAGTIDTDGIGHVVNP